MVTVFQNTSGVLALGESFAFLSQPGLENQAKDLNPHVAGVPSRNTEVVKLSHLWWRGRKVSHSCDETE